MAVAVGGNLPGRHASVRDGLQAAVDALPAAGFDVTACSGWWRSVAWPDANDPPFLNAVVLARTRLSPHEALAALRTLEIAFGRERRRVNAPRTLDLDLLGYGDLLLDDPDLTLPHPRARDRLFVMGPLAELAPEWRWPDGATAATLAQTATVGLDARPLDPRS